MILKYEDFMMKSENVNIYNTIDTWINLKGEIDSFEDCVATLSMLTDEELKEAKTMLLVHGITKKNFHDYFRSFLKGYFFIGKNFNLKHYKTVFICGGVEIGYPLYYDYIIKSKKVHIPQKMGLYHLFFKGMLVYIGFSRNIKKRLNQHHTDKYIDFDAVLWFTDNEKSLRDWLDFERDLIQYWKPSFNKNYLEC